MARDLARHNEARDRALDLCRREVKRRYKKWPSARASQAVCKCRKRKGYPCKGKKLGQWAKQKWINTKTGKPCGSGGPRPYGRPTKGGGYTPVLAKDAPKSKERERGRRKPLPTGRSGSRRRGSKQAKARPSS